MKNALFCPFLDFKVHKRTKKEASPDPLAPLPNPPLKGGNIHFFVFKSRFMEASKTRKYYRANRAKKKIDGPN